MFLMNLPNISIETQIPDDTVLFVLGGRAPSESWLSAIAFQTEVWAVDRGVNVCDAAGIVPSMLIGDADSADSVIWQKMSKKVLGFTSRKWLCFFTGLLTGLVVGGLAGLRG